MRKNFTNGNKRDSLYLIRKFTQEHDLILDPCGGVGTVAIACESLHRHCTIIEMEEERIQEIKGRLVLLRQGKETYQDLVWTPAGT